MKAFIVSSDRGGAVKFGSETHGFEALFYPTTFGDGNIKVIVCSDKEYFEEFEKKDKEGRFFGGLDGRFHLYEDDCGREILATFEGEYSLYDQRDPYKPTLVIKESFLSKCEIVYEKKAKRGKKKK